MAKYLTHYTSHLEGRVVHASVTEPAVLTVPDDTIPHYRWKPLDKAATDALLKLKAELTKANADKSVIAQIAVEPVAEPPPKPAKEVPTTLAEMQTHGKGKGKRPSDQEPV